MYYTFQYSANKAEAILTGLSEDGYRFLNDNNKTLPEFPTHIGGIPVTTIANHAFANLGIATLPESWGNITALGIDCFYGNNLTRIGDWGTVTHIGSNAFGNNRIAILPSSWGNVTMIDAGAFRSNEISFLPESWQDIREVRYATFLRNNLEEVPDLTDLKFVGSLAFGRNNIATLPEVKPGWVAGEIFAGNPFKPKTEF